jgi:diguanylate cyclase (GGDEF)-like protein
LVLLDLDHIKKVNDTHGHAAGDDVLRAAARVLGSVCRDVDLAARLGGEELAILLPETDASGARTVAERVRERMEGTPHRSPAGKAFRVTTSIGVGSLGTGAHDAESLLQSADEALYRAKSGGRNRVVLSGRS